jgi:hypothetical protein
MSWRTGSSLFWEFWPKVKAGITDAEHRAMFARDLVTLFLNHDVDPGDMRGVDAEIDQIMDEVDPKL